MNEHRQLPAFASEREEADWWYANREEMDNEFAAAIRDGRARPSTLAERVASAKSIILDAEDEAKVRALADKRGLDYKALVKELVHEALVRSTDVAA